MLLKRVVSRIVRPVSPYDFGLSVRNLSYYPVPTNTWDNRALRFTIRWRGEPLGVRFTNRGSPTHPAIALAIFGRRKIDKDRALEILRELSYRFEWDVDYRPFYQTVGNDSLLRPAVERLRGMRSFCAESLYELLMICILLQNANVKRTEAMTRAMLETYGDKVEFDGHSLYCFWSPKRILASTEVELRGLSVGYRAKSFLRATRDCANLNEEELRAMDDDGLRKALLGIYGVGPATGDYLMQGAFHRTSVFDTIPPWECKIFSRILFNKPVGSPRRVQAELARRYGSWRGLASHYLFMDLCWRHKKQPIEWFAKLMPY